MCEYQFLNILLFGDTRARLQVETIKSGETQAHARVCMDVFFKWKTFVEICKSGFRRFYSSPLCQVLICISGVQVPNYTLFSVRSRAIVVVCSLLKGGKGCACVNFISSQTFAHTHSHDRYGTHLYPEYDYSAPRNTNIYTHVI